MNLSKYAENVLKEKEIDINDENTRTVIKQLKAKVSKRYNAVCLGIDGTLENIEDPNDQIITTLYNILNKHIPIVLITGRGESGLKDFYNKISNRLILEKKLNKELVKNIIAVTNDGEILFYTSEIEKEHIDSSKILDQYRLLIDENDLDEIIKAKEHLMSFFNGNSNVSYSESVFPTLNNRLMSFRLIVEDRNDLNKIEKFIEYYIESQKKRNPSSQICYTTGKYREKDVFQIGIGDKSEAIKAVERFLGIPENSMLRIGDQGNENGNDYSMLNCCQGYSVDKCSHDINNCYPVCDENGNLLKGIEATEYLLKNSKLFPTICLKKPDKQRYTRQLSISEKKIKKGKREIINKYNSIINDVFNISDGFEDIFDKKSGAIVFDDWEWNLIDDNNELKQLFSENENGRYKYSLDTDTSKLLRGSDTYYYFLANKTKKEPDNNLIMTWYINYADFFKKAYLILNNYKIKDNTADLKLLLGVLDNIRNVALINLNASIVSEYPDSHVLLSLDTYMKNNKIKDWFNLCNLTYDQMEKICFSTEKIDQCIEAIKNILGSILEKYPQIVGEILSKEDLQLNKRCFRTYREIDNYIENYITMNLSIQNLRNERYDFLDREINFSGLLYGGMELPLLAKNILSKKICDLDTSALLIKKDNYNEMHSDEFFDSLIKQDLRIESKRNYEKGLNILSDDNVLTGVTLQAALELLFEKNIYVDNLAVVRYPSINRIEHMFSNNRGAIDTSKFTTYIKGLIFPSPYSKIKNGEEYTDELGIFNKSRDRIIKYLYKNGRFSKNSEVDKVIQNKEKDCDVSR